MAYICQDKKKDIAQKLKLALKKSGLKYSLSIRDGMVLVMKIRSGPVDFVQNMIDVNANRLYGEKFSAEQIEFLKKRDCIDVNVYHYKKHFDGEALRLLDIILPILNDGNHDDSDIQSDYFDVGWYVDVMIGDYKKPYQLIKE